MQLSGPEFAEMLRPAIKWPAITHKTEPDPWKP
jgi:hypothetical protein